MVPGAAVLDEAIGWAVELAAGPVVAHGLAKAAIDGGIESELATGLDLEQELFAEVFSTEDAHTGVRSFLEHGPGRAHFAGR